MIFRFFFKKENFSVKASVAKIPWLKSSFIGFISGVLIDGELIEFTTYNSSKLLACKVTDYFVLISFENPEFNLDIKLTRKKPTKLVAPISGFMDSRVEECMDGKMEVFLKELQTTAAIERFDDSTKDRVVQLIAKTNQFKLNPNQFTPKELSAKNREVLCIRLKDRLQDYGIVAVAVLSIVKNRLRIENWVMSCRVFSRRLEYLTFDLIVEQACKHGINEIDLAYIPSAKNTLIYDLLEVLNFKETGLKNHFSTSVRKFKESVNLLPHHIRVVKQ